MNNSNRVLGRVLAVEETQAVSGAKSTSTSATNGTFPPKDTGYVYDIIPVDDLDSGSPSFRTMSL